MMTPYRLFGRRKGRPLRARQVQLIKDLLPRLQIALPATASLDPAALFPSARQEIWLEIGFGGGEHLLHRARQHPALGLIGAEPFMNGTAKLLSSIDREKIENIRILPDDARPLLETLIAASIDRCFLLFPDPWPKARHAERRFLGQDNLTRLARVLRQEAELCVATDDAKLGPWMLDQIKSHPAFEIKNASPVPPSDWVPTRYEQKAKKAGRAIVYIGICRKDR